MKTKKTKGQLVKEQEIKDGKSLYREMTKKGCKGAIVPFGPRPMVYLAEGIYLMDNGEMFHDK